MIFWNRYVQSGFPPLVKHGFGRAYPHRAVVRSTLFSEKVMVMASVTG